MKRVILLGAVAVALSAGSMAIAQPGDRGGHGRDDRGRGDDRGDNGRHAGWGQDRGNGHRWNRGERMGYNDWNGAQRVDYRRYHLNQPPRGYEWRRQNDQFVLGAIATGLISSIVLANGR